MLESKIDKQKEKHIDALRKIGHENSFIVAICQYERL